MNHPLTSFSSYPKRLRDCEAWAMAMHNNNQPGAPSSSPHPSRYHALSGSDFTFLLFNLTIFSNYRKAHAFTFLHSLLLFHLHYFTPPSSFLLDSIFFTTLRSAFHYPYTFLSIPLYTAINRPLLTRYRFWTFSHL